MYNSDDGNRSETTYFLDFIHCAVSKEITKSKTKFQKWIQFLKVFTFCIYETQDEGKSLEDK